MAEVTTYGFHASHEQVHPAVLLEAVQQAEQAGFQAAMCSDHFFPWSTRQGHSGFAWSWLGAALQATSLPFGVVTAPGQRYHPAIVAQAAMTLAAMYPGRFWAALGSGQLLNEHVTGEPWPSKEVRNARLAESADVMRRLFAGERVSHDGIIRVDRAQLFSTAEAEHRPRLLAAALTPATAAWAAQWAEGLITVEPGDGSLPAVLDAYRDAGGNGPLCVQAHVSWAPSQDEALHIAHDQWRTNVFPSHVLADQATEHDFDALGEFVRPGDVDGPVRVSSDLGRHTAWLAEYAEQGVDQVYVHHVGQQQEAFIEAFGTAVLPQITAG